MPGKTVAPVLSRSCRTARGIGSELKTIGTPRASSGVIRLLNPYEWESGMTAKLRSASGDSHRVANVVAIGEQLFAAKANRAGRGGGSGGKFEKRRRPSAPVGLGALVADRDRIIALLRAD